MLRKTLLTTFFSVLFLSFAAIADDDGAGSTNTGKGGPHTGKGPKSGVAKTKKKHHHDEKAPVPEASPAASP